MTPSAHEAPAATAAGGVTIVISGAWYTGTDDESAREVSYQEGSGAFDFKPAGAAAE